MTTEKKNNKKEPECPLCQVPAETIQTLKAKGKEKYLLKRKKKEEEILRRIRQKRVKRIFSFLFIILLAGGAVFGFKYIGEKSGISQVAEAQTIKVFYSPDCSCCHQYISYLKRNGFEVLEEKEMAKRVEILEKYQIPNEMTACHTSIIGDYFIEGHMPVEVVEKLLKEKPEIDGIALPGMPQGSPGMSGFKTGQWTIYSLSNGQPAEFILF